MYPRCVIFTISLCFIYPCYTHWVFYVPYSGNKVIQVVDNIPVQDQQFSIYIVFPFYFTNNITFKTETIVTYIIYNLR